MKKVDVAVFETIKAAQEGTFTGGTDTVFDVESDGVGLGKIAAAGRSSPRKVDAIKQEIAAGEIEIPDHGQVGAPDARWRTHRHAGDGRGARSRASRHHQALRRRCRQRRASTGAARGEIHALLGENGAGQVDADERPLRDAAAGRGRDPGRRAARSRSARRARRWSTAIGMVFQHFMLIPVMTVAENIVLGGRAADGRRPARRRGRGRSGCASSPSATGWPSTRDARGRGHHRRPAAAGRDPARARPRAPTSSCSTSRPPC